MVSWAIWRHGKRVGLGGLGLDDARPWRAVELRKAFGRVMTFVGYKIARIFRRRGARSRRRGLASEARQGRGGWRIVQITTNQPSARRNAIPTGFLAKSARTASVWFTASPTGLSQRD
jgi:hypothetical protein